MFSHVFEQHKKFFVIARMGNAQDIITSDASSERLIYRSWRGVQEAPPHPGGRKLAFVNSGPATSNAYNSRIRRSLSTGNLADHLLIQSSATSVIASPLSAAGGGGANDAGDQETMDLELAAFRKLCHDVTALLIGPQFITASPSPSPSPSPQPSGASTSPTAAPPKQLVVNHLYHPVLQKVKDHLGGLPEWYTLKTSPAEAANHIRLLVEARKYELGRVAVSVSPLMQPQSDNQPVHGMYVVVVCAKDRRQLLDAITRCVSQRASIMEATIITTRDSFALDRFVMKKEDGGEASDDEDVTFWGESLKRDIEEVIGCLPPSPQLKPAQKRRASRIPSLGAIAKAWEVPFQEIRLIRVLGQGRTGRTFLAEWRGERVAAKVLSLEDDLVNSGIRVEQFQSELALVSRLDHPNVVKFVGASARPPRYIILFELCEGDILALVKNPKKKRYSFFHLALGAAHGLAYLHRNQIMHRDVKPENLMLDKLGRVKVVDFGLSVYLGEKKKNEPTAETGTYRYMAPEVMLHQAYSFPADVYSFGMVMWVLLTRKAPFEESTPLQTAMAVARSEARPKMPSSVPPALASLIRACWDKDPSVRPTFEDIIAGLQGIQKNLTKKEKSVLDPEMM
jgi:hypothetical protein